MSNNFEHQMQNKAQTQPFKNQKPQLKISQIIKPPQRFGHQPSIMYRPQIDGLRSIAVIPVIFFHFKLFESYTAGGFLGVDVFFVISGFLVNSIIISQLLKDKFSLLVFYERRVRRLFPAMFTTLAICLLIGYLLYIRKSQYQQLVKQQTAALSSVSNIYFYLNRENMGDGYFDDNTQKWPFLHFWSLGIEQQFYMMTPIILLLLKKYTSSKKFPAYLSYCMMTTMIISLLLSIWLTESDQMFAFYLLPCRAWELSMGGFIAIILHGELIEKIGTFKNSIKLFRREKVITILLQIISWGGLIMIIASYAIFQKEDHLPGYKALLPCSGVALYIAANFIRYQNKIAVPTQDSAVQNQQQKDTKQRKVLTSAAFLSFGPIVWVGKISYSLYLWHWPIWVFSNYFLERNLTLENKVFCIILTFMCSQLSTLFIENPIRNKKKLSTKSLWKCFATIWILFMIFLVCNIAFNAGQQKIMDINSSLDNTENSTIKQSGNKYDSQGFLLTSPYRSLNASQISLQKLKNPTYASQDIRISNEQVNNPDPNYKPVLINYSQQDFKQNKRVCLAALGSSHTQHHLETLRELALQYNISLAVMAGRAKTLNFNTSKKNQKWDNWRYNQLKIYKPKMIFASNFQLAGDHKVIYIKNALDPLLALPQPPQYIGLFGDNPIAGFGWNLQIGKMDQYLQKKYIQNQGWDFIEKLNQLTIKEQQEYEEELTKYIAENYNTDIVKYYPYLYQLFQDPQTGFIQLVGAEADGRLLYRDFHHLTVDGSRRFKRYFAQKLFKRAKQLCQQ